MSISDYHLLIVFGAIFLGLELVLYMMRHKKLRQQQRQLIRAKKETQEIVQLPLQTPYPLIQIDKKGNILFANFVALKVFPDLEKSQDKPHPIISNITETGMREIIYHDTIYHQTITETTVSGQEAFILYCYDITQQKRHEKALEKAYKETEKALAVAEDAKEARGQFLANMSHELRTPMNGIIGLSDILVEYDFQDDQRELIEAINSSSRNLLILLNDVLDFSKIEAGELTTEIIPFDIRKLIAQIELLQKPVASQKALVLEGIVANHVPAYLMGDPSRLQQILNNLTSNALKFTKDGSIALTVDGQQTKDDMFIMTIAVTDTGIGIPADKQDLIFEKFQQADSSTARKYGGTGLGLAITKELAHLMGGTIELTSTEGEGTTVQLTLPLKICEVMTDREDTCTAPANEGINLHSKIMIVDDHPINLLYMRNALSRLGFENLDEVSSGRKALSLIENKDFDLILMDCQMPDMDGYETTQKIRLTDKTTVIIAITADVLDIAKDKCMEAGMNDYISKPVDKEKLCALLKKWLPGGDTAVAQTTEDEKKHGATSNTAQASMIDPVIMADITNNDPAMEEKIQTIFFDNLNQDIDRMKQHYQEADYKQWDAVVHKIYGSCSNLGVKAMADLCNKGQTLYPDHVADIPKFHEGIIREYKQICDHYS